jgi:hypothetical protein
MGIQAMFLKAQSIRSGVVAVLVCGLLMTSCGGFGSSNNTAPGNTPNISAQTSFRIVGRVGTPFSAKISDTRSSWTITGVVPLSIVIVNNSPPVRVSVNKLVSDHSLLSLEIINGFSVKQLASGTDNFAVAVGAFGHVANFAPPAVPDVRFFVKGPTKELFDALIEDTSQGEVVEARPPALILFDSPAGGTGGRVDGIFTAVGFTGSFNIDLIYDGVIAVSVPNGGTSVTIKYP